jgi:hypothetical protein
MLQSLLKLLNTLCKYLDNLYTVKNRVARKKVSKKDLFIIKAKNSTRAQVLKLKARYIKEEKAKLNSLNYNSCIAREKVLYL